MLRASLLAAVLVLSACDGGSDPVGVTGTWEGEVFAAAPGAARYPVTARLVDRGVTVTGTGVVELPGADVFNFTVSGGSFDGSAVSLDLRFDTTPFTGAIVGRLTGTDPGRIEGTFQGGGVVGDSRIEIELTDR